MWHGSIPRGKFIGIVIFYRAEIGKYLDRNPNAGPKQTKSALAAKGIEVSESLVGYVKYAASKKSAVKARRVKKKAAKKRRPAKKRRATRKNTARRKSSRTRPLEDVKQAGDLMLRAVDLVIKAGAKEARQLVSTAEDVIRTIRAQKRSRSSSRSRRRS